MIYVKDNLFALHTEAVSYIFRVTDSLHLEHLHFGRKITVDGGSIQAMKEKHEFLTGSLNSYDEEHRSLSLENYLLEMSSYGKGDIREPFVEIIYADGSSTSDFLYDGYKVLHEKPVYETLPGSYSDYGRSEQLVIYLRERYSGIIIELHYYVYERCDVICRSAKLRNESNDAVTLRRLMSAQVDFDDSDYIFTHFNGAWIREMKRVDTAVTAGRFVNSSYTGTSSNRANPFVMLSRRGTSQNFGECYGFNLIYSGNHYEAVDVGCFSKLRFVNGINPQGFSYIVGPGGCFEAPESVMSYSDKGFNGLSGNMHEFVREHITDYVRQGEHTVAIRVNNVWQEDLAPRSGEHMFTGGIYRDVNIVITSPVHITWYGTFVQTPEVSKEGSFVRMQAEVQNESGAPQNVRVAHNVYDADNGLVKSFGSETRTIAAGAIYNFDNTSDYLSNPHLWTPDSPYMYKVITDVYVDGVSVDRYETPLGFRWMEWTADEGFFLNGEHFWIDGTNAHQDHAGWANAVTTAALKRDVAMIKEVGLNFIRGSHYPHSPAYAEACDEQGILFWSEAPFWCTSAWGEGTSDGNSGDYLADGYPTTGDPETEARFEQSCLDSLRDMIRINRNHPSIIIWSMGNEAFFGDNHTKKKALISRMAAYAKELDPTRKAAMGGTQMGGYDKLPNVDVAGYNGDGAEKSEYQDPGVPNMVVEYSSHSGNRPDKFEAYYGSVATDSNGNPLEPAWRCGHALWCAFHHGSILSRSYGDMGFIDYYRLPLQIWYYYREKNTGVERECSTDGTAAKLAITASDTVISNDGTKDTHIIVTVEDEDGNWVNKEPEVILEIVDGPGIFPTGKTMSFKPGDSMRDGKAAIEFRSYYAGTTTIEAYSPSNPDIEPASVTITTTGSGGQAEPDISTMYGAFMSNGGIVPNTVEEAKAYRFVNYKGCPMNASSGDSGEYTCKNILDGDKQTEWKAQVPGSGQWVYVELEHGGLNLYKAQLSFKGKKYPYKIQYRKQILTTPSGLH